VGRPLGDIKPNLQVADLPGLIRDAMARMHYREENVQDLEGRTYAMKIRPSKTPDGKIEGAILALTDVDALLRSQQNRRSLDASLTHLLREPPDLLLAVSPEGQPLFMNRSLLADVPGVDRSIFDCLAPQDREPMRRSLRQALQKRVPAEIEVQEFSLGSTGSPVILTIEPILGAEGVLAFGVRTKDSPASRSSASRSAGTPQ
jgi:hypothetical protein